MNEGSARLDDDGDLVVVTMNKPVERHKPSLKSSIGSAAHGPMCFGHIPSSLRLFEHRQLRRKAHLLSRPSRGRFCYCYQSVGLAHWRWLMRSASLMSCRRAASHASFELNGT